jgi:hypothetical protein
MSPTEVSMYNHHFGLSMVIHPVPNYLSHRIQTSYFFPHFMHKQSFEHHSLVPISCSIDLQRVLQVMEFIYPAKENLKIPIIGLLQQNQSRSLYRKNTQNLIWNVKKTTQMFTSSYNTIKNPLNLPVLGPQKEELTGVMKYVQQNYVVQLAGSGHSEEETWHPRRIWIQISLEMRTNLWVTTGHPAVYTLGYWFWYLFFIQINPCYMVHHLDWHNL